MVERAYKYRFFPTTEQENLLRRTMGCVRLVYNKALATKIEGWHQRQERIDYKQTSSLLTSWKKNEDLDFLNEVSSVPLQQCLRHLQKAFANFWGKRAKYPRFKVKRNGGSAEFTKSAFKYRDGKLWLAKSQEPLNIVWSRLLPDGTSPSTVTVKLEPSGRWFVSLWVDDPTIQPLPPTDTSRFGWEATCGQALCHPKADCKKVGIHAGIDRLLTTSDGDKITNPKHFNRLYQKLKVAQKELSRKTKGSNNRYKARLEVAKIHAKIKDARTDFLHKLTTDLVRANSIIVIEDFAIRDMVKNHKLARSISDTAWGKMFRQLEYKCEWYGRTLVKIDRSFPSSKRCNHCGFVMDALQGMPLDIRSWDCPSCETKEIDRNINAGKNILAAGLAVEVASGRVSRPVYDDHIVCGADIRPDRHSSKARRAVAGVPPVVLKDTPSDKATEQDGQLRKTSRRKKQKPKS